MEMTTSSYAIEIKEDAIPYSLEHFVIPSHYEDDVESILLPHGIILDRIEKLARQVCTDYLTRNPSNSGSSNSNKSSNGLVMICVLKGGHQFFADMLNAIKRLNQSMARSIPIALEFIKVKSYHNDQSTGQVSVELTGNETWEDVGKRWQGRDILVIEDIVDTGRTMVALLDKLNKLKAASVKVASLFVKRTPLSNGYRPDYAGFSIPDKFIVGYCLDYNEVFRDLEHVCVISDHGRIKYAQHPQ